MITFEDKPMNVVFCSNETYLQYCAVTIISLFENNKDQTINIHILSDDTSIKSKKRIEEIVERYNGTITFYQVDNNQFFGLSMAWSVYAWYRCLIPELLSKNIGKVLYLDADTCVVGNIGELFKINLESIAVAAVTDVETISDHTFQRLGYPKQDLYFCSGVLLMNLDLWRSTNLKQQVFDYARKNVDTLLFGDQDPLNYICRNNKLHLPLKYGILGNFVLNKVFMKQFRSEVCDLLDDPKIVHYAGLAPWVYELNRHFMRDEFNKYAALYGPVYKKHLFTGVNLVKHRIKMALISSKIYKPNWWISIPTKKQIREKINTI